MLLIEPLNFRIPSWVPAELGMLRVLPPTVAPVNPDSTVKDAVSDSEPHRPASMRFVPHRILLADPRVSRR